MKLQFFNIPAKWPDEAQLSLNAYCAKNRVLSIEKQFVNLGEGSYWSVCITAMEWLGSEAIDAAE